MTRSKFTTPEAIADELKAFRALDFESVLVNGPIIQGIVLDSFTLSVEKGEIKDKEGRLRGSLYSVDPQKWTPTTLFFNKGSKLYINLPTYVKDKRIQLTLKLMTSGNENPQFGKVQVDFDCMETKIKNTVSITLRNSTYWKDYHVQSKSSIRNDYTWIMISSVDFFDWSFMEVNVEIFTPYL